MAAPKVYTHSVGGDSWTAERPFLYFDYESWGTFSGSLTVGWGTAVAPKYKVGNWTYTGTGKIIFPMNGIYTITANMAWGPATASAIANLSIYTYDSAGTNKHLSPCAAQQTPQTSDGYFAGSVTWTGFMRKGEMTAISIYTSGSAAQVIEANSNLSIIYTGGLAV